jgi:predicted metal-dependent peptidase
MAQPRLTPAQRLQRSHIALMRSPRFALLSGIILLGDSCVDDGIPTAYTDGQNKVYGRRFLNTLTDKQINFVVAHENFHVLYKHITTWQGLWKQNPRLANVACDYVINQQILDLDPEGKDIELPDLPLCIDEQYRGWNAHQVYEHLKQQHEESSEDEHDNDPDSFDEHGFDAAQSTSDQARRDLHQAIDRAARQGDSLASQLNATTAREIGAISEPRVDWGFCAIRLRGPN